MERHAVADEENTLSYLDMNNLYGHSMTQRLPIDSFEWVENVTEETLRNLPEVYIYSLYKWRNEITDKNIHIFRM